MIAIVQINAYLIKGIEIFSEVFILNLGTAKKGVGEAQKGIGHNLNKEFSLLLNDHG